jgi:hypothetical protein
MMTFTRRRGGAKMMPRAAGSVVISAVVPAAAIAEKSDFAALRRIFAPSRLRVNRTSFFSPRLRASARIRSSSKAAR